MTRPRLLDLFCGAGGAAEGYCRAGFAVTGVDISSQPRYPFTFIQADAMTFPLDGFDAVHASPPCQDHSATRDFGGDHGTGWMLTATRDRLAASGLPWVIENVRGAPMASQPDLFGAHGFTLCGCMFAELRGLIYRPRQFEASFPWISPRTTGTCGSRPRWAASRSPMSACMSSGTSRMLRRHGGEWASGG